MVHDNSASNALQTPGRNNATTPAVVTGTPHINPPPTNPNAGRNVRSRNELTPFYVTRDPLPEPDFFSSKKAPATYAKETLAAAFASLPLIPDAKRDLLSNSFSHHFFEIQKKSTIAKRFEDPTWTLIPLKTKPLLTAPALADTDFFREIQDREKALQEQYKTGMTKLMQEIADEQVKKAKIKLLADLVSFIRNLVKAHGILYPGESGDSLGNTDYVVYNVLHLSELETVMNMNDDGTPNFGQQSKGLRFLLFDGINCGSELLNLVNIDLPADAQSFNANDFAQECSKKIQEIVTKSIFKANDIFNATIKNAKHRQSIAGVFDEDLKETAATAMIQEFDMATGPAQTQVINEATQKFIENKNNELATKIERLEGIIKNGQRGANKASAASKKKKASSKADSTKKESKKSKKKPKKVAKKAKKTGRNKEKRAADRDNATKSDKS